MGHRGVKGLERAVTGLHTDPIGANHQNCEVCARANIKRFPFPKQSDTRAERLLFRVHLDLCGPLPNGFGGVKYFMPIVDCFSRWRNTRFLKRKSDALDEFIKYRTAVERFTNLKIAVIRLDNARELVLGDFQRYADAEGITLEKIIPDASPQNGVAERSNALLASMARAMLIDAGFTDWFWPLAVQAATHIINRLPTAALPAGKTPFHLWMKKPPNLSHLRIFGTRVVSRKTNSDSLNKITPRGEQGRFVGYATDAKGYLIWFPESHTVLPRRDVIFLDPPDQPATNPVDSSTMWDDVLFDLERRFTEPAQRDVPQRNLVTKSPYVLLFASRVYCTHDVSSGRL